MKTADTANSSSPPSLCHTVQLPDGFDAYGSATLSMIDMVCQEVQDYLNDQNLSHLCFDVCLGVREALTNAVRHGARFDPSVTISLRLRKDEESLRITVEDGGPGFDWRTALARVAEANEESGRGLAILKDYFRTFNFNEIGNKVTLIKDFVITQEINSGKETMKSEITMQGNVAVVKPGRDIVASMAGEFRRELLDTISGGAARIIIDLAGVGMVDSMGIGVLIAAHNSLQKNGSRLEIRNVSADILKLFRNMRLDQHFSVA